jgi:hypothetical protein
MKRALTIAMLAAVLGTASVGGARPRSGSSLRTAVAVVKGHGYRPDVSTWENAFKLNVLIGTFTKSADGYNKRAFFFFGSRYLGTDASAPSAQLQEVWRDDRTIALLYILYRNSDPLCCPTAGGAIVRFRWNGSRLVALDPIPPTRGRRHR